MVAYLLDSTTLRYAVAGQPSITRHCRTWALADGSALCVVTELPDDPGMSITNAAEQVRSTLEAIWGRGCRIVEHYPWPNDEHYDEQHRESDGRTRWKRLDAAALLQELGPALTTTSPTEAAR